MDIIVSRVLLLVLASFLPHIRDPFLGHRSQRLVHGVGIPTWATMRKPWPTMLISCALDSSPLRISVKSTVPPLSFAPRCFRSLAFRATLRTRLLQASTTFMPFRHRKAAMGTMGLCHPQQRQTSPTLAPSTSGVSRFPPVSPAHVLPLKIQAKNFAKRTVWRART